MINSELSEPPPAWSGKSSRQQIDSIISQLDYGLSYTTYNSASGDSFMNVDAHGLKITGEIAGSEMDRLSSMSEFEGISSLRRRVSRGMARIAKLNGVSYDDHEMAFPVFISPTYAGTAYMLFRDPAERAIITSKRKGRDNEILSIESFDIEKLYQQKILLGGLAAFLSALETKPVRRMIFNQSAN